VEETAGEMQIDSGTTIAVVMIRGWSFTDPFSLNYHMVKMVKPARGRT
jgi:hypothetical protein